MPPNLVSFEADPQGEAGPPDRVEVGERAKFVYVDDSEAKEHLACPTSINPVHNGHLTRDEALRGSFAQGTPHRVSDTCIEEQPNTLMVLTNPGAAQSVLRPLCLLSGLAAHQHVVQKLPTPRASAAVRSLRP